MQVDIFRSERNTMSSYSTGATRLSSAHKHISVVVKVKVPGAAAVWYHHPERHAEPHKKNATFSQQLMQPGERELFDPV